MALACLAAPVAASRIRFAPPSTRGSARPTAAPRIDASRNARDSVSRRGATTTVRATKQSYASFDDMIEKSPVPVLVDFYATWCGPCVLIASELEKVKAELGDGVRIVKVDTDEEDELSTQLSIQGLPTLVFVGTDTSKPALRTEGMLPAEMVKTIIANEL